MVKEERTLADKNPFFSVSVKVIHDNNDFISIRVHKKETDNLCKRKPFLHTLEESSWIL